jgi:hypothetical protein
MKKRVGRPSSYTDERAAEICGRLAAGESLNRMCKDDHMPDIVTVYRWLTANEQFRKNYALAREDQAETHADLIQDIADEPPPNDMNGKTDNGWVTWQKNRIDARKWVASKLKPKRYGDKIDVTSDGKQVGLAIAIDLSEKAKPEVA